MHICMECFRFLCVVLVAKAFTGAGTEIVPLESLGTASLAEWGRLRLSIAELRKTHTVKVLTLMRHAEAESNVAERAVGHERWYQELSRLDTYFDPPLTTLGISQAQQLSVTLGGAMTAGLRPDLVLVSPLLRALQTAQLAYNATSTASIRRRSLIVAREDLRAVLGVQTCNRRRPTDILKDWFPGADFESYMVPDVPMASAGGVSSSESSAPSILGDPLWKADTRETDKELEARAERFLQWVWRQPESSLAVVTHHGMLGAMRSVLSRDEEEEEEEEGKGDNAATVAARNVMRGGDFGYDIGNAEATVMLLASRHGSGLQLPPQESGIWVLGKAMVLLALLKVSVLVCCYGAYRKIKPYMMPRENVSQGPSEDSEEVAGGEQIRYKGVLYVRVAQADTPLEDTNLPPLDPDERASS